MRPYDDSIATNPITEMCIVLDVDETLVHTFESLHDLLHIDVSNTYYKKIKRRSYNFVYRTYSENVANPSFNRLVGIKRPFLDEFITFCFNYFKYVIVWSAGEDSYVRSICRQIFKDRKPYAILTRNKCAGDKYNKPLSILFNDPLFRNSITERNTIIVDDKYESVSSNINNAIIIPPYIPTINDLVDGNDDDVYLLNLITWLQNYKVLTNTDITHISKSSVFDDTNIRDKFMAIP